MRWTPNEVAAATGGEATVRRPSETIGAGVTDSTETSLTGVSVDTRGLSAGALFVALRAQRDGHDWIGAALEAGAGAVLVDRVWAGSASRSTVPVPVIVVADTAEALLALGRAGRDRLAGPVVGITGSVGKTSTKDLTAAALATVLRTTSSEKSFNNEIGVPLTLVNAPIDTEVAVIEMGARGAGHIGRLCQVARPTVGVVTAVAAAHTEVFGDLVAVAAAKAELVAALPSDGTAVLNADDPRVVAMANGTSARILRYSVRTAGSTGAELIAEGVDLDDGLRPRFVARTPWGSVDVRLEARGAHQVGNALAALAVAGELGVGLEAAAAALRAAELSPWRMELRHTRGGAVVLNDAYNANPASMAAALEALAALPAVRRIAVLGEMAELGARRGEEHAAITLLAERLGVELLAVGTEAYGLAPFDGLDDAVAALGSLGPGDAVLVKASRVARLERLAARLVDS